MNSAKLLMKLAVNNIYSKQVILMKWRVLIGYIYV